MDLQNMFTAILNRSLTGSIVIGCVLLARLVLKKAPRVYAWALWLVVLLRLICPVSIPGPVSVLELVDAPLTPSGAVEFVEPPVQAPLETITPIGPGEIVQTVPSPSAPPIDWNLMASRVWLLGAAGLLAYGIFSYVNLRRKLRESIPLGRGIRECDGIGTAFVLMHTIYLPTDLEAEERKYILLHEQLHLRHGDPIVKALFWLAVCIHWFNPLVWLSFFLCSRDMELRCDEAVLKRLGPQVRSDYAQSLLNFAAGRRFTPAPLAFGEGDTGKRVKFVLRWKKTKLWLAAAGGLLCAAVLLLTACDPAAPVGDDPFGHSYRCDHISMPVEHRTSVSRKKSYTLTSDMGLFVRKDETELMGFFREASADWDEIPDLPDHRKPGKLHRSWQIAENNWWLLELKNGELWLLDGPHGILYRLARTDLLGVSIRQPGMESHVEPVWYRFYAQNYPAEEMSVTLVDGDAKIILTSEADVDRLHVSEEYYERQPNGETTVTIHDHFLERDEQGEFSLDVSRRGVFGDDYAIYLVTVGDDYYAFQLSFPAVPGETSFSVDLEEPTHPVTYSENGATITLQLPDHWAYSLLSTDAPEYDASMTGGITFWPRGREEGKIFFGFYPDLFAVCGTGLETTEMVLAGKSASVGTYDGREVWDFIRFDDHFAVWGQNHEAWWAEYGDEAMTILDSAVFSNE